MNIETMNTLTLDRVDGVALVRLNRPPVNAVNREMQLELRDCFNVLSNDRSIGAVVLSAAGDRAFCGGIDLRQLPDAQQDGEAAPVRAIMDNGWEWREAQRAIRHCTVPVVAAVDGAAIGAGFGLVAMCDIIIASERATFGLTEINVGLLGGASKALRMVGPFKARMMFFSGHLVPAAEFHRLGAVETVVAPGNAEASALDLARELATKSPLAMRLAKESLLRIEGDGSDDQYRTEQDYTTRLRGLNDSREAMEAYLQKRAPVWTWS